MKRGRIKLLIILITLMAWNAIHAQEIYYTKNGHIDFYSSTPVEDIEAINTKVNSVMNISTGDIEFSVLIMAFQFEKALMQEHFNEKFMESEKFPKATFKGKITNLESIDFSSKGEYPVKVAGDITIHGVTKRINTNGTFKVEDAGIIANSVFHLAPADFDIKIPSVVRNNIAKDIRVTVKSTYKPFNK
jgi:hypothetical protein